LRYFRHEVAYVLIEVEETRKKLLEFGVEYAAVLKKHESVYEEFVAMVPEGRML